MPHPRRPPPPISSPVVVAAIDKIPNFRSLLGAGRSLHLIAARSREGHIWASSTAFHGTSVPWPHARHWRIHHHEARGATLVCCGEGEGHHVADVVADYIGLANVQRVEHTSDVFGLVLFGEAVGCGCDKPMPRKSGAMTV